MGEDIEINDIHALFGYYGESSCVDALNFVILHAKSFITKMTYTRYEPLLYAMFVKLKIALQVEKCICQKYENAERFDVRFGKLQDALN
jgi:hypothetical protein